jgi:hypothetical protein
MSTDSPQHDALSTGAQGRASLVLLGVAAAAAVFAALWMTRYDATAPVVAALLLMTLLTVACRQALAALTGPMLPVAVAGAVAAWGLLLLPLVPSGNVPYLVTVYPYAVVGIWVLAIAWVVHQHFHAWFNTVMLLFIAALALLLRLKGLTHTSFWNDELLSVTQCDPDNSLGVMLDQSLTRNDIPPLYFILLWGWFKAVGLGEFSARLLSVIIGVACLPGMYLLGRRLARPGVGLIAALLMALSWVHLEYSQDARPYVLLIFLTIVAWLAFLRYLEAPTWKHTAFWTLAALLLVYTHLFGWLVLLAQAITLAAAAAERPRGVRNRLWLRATLVAALTGACYLPYVPRMLASLNTPSFWAPKPTPLMFVDYFTAFFHDPALALLCAALIGALLIHAYTHEDARLRGALFLIAVWLVVGYFVPVIHSYNTPTPVMVFRYFVILLPALLLLVAMAIDRVRRVPARTLLLGLVGLLCALDLFVVGNYYQRPSFQEYRQLVAALPTEENGLYFAKLKQTFKFQFYFEQRGAAIEVHEATPESLQEVLPARLDDPALTIWVLENVQFYGVVVDPAFLAFMERFLIPGRTIERLLVRARAYQIDPAHRDELRELLQRDQDQWPKAEAPAAVPHAEAMP